MSTSSGDNVAGTLGSALSVNTGFGASQETLVTPEGLFVPSTVLPPEAVD